MSQTPYPEHLNPFAERKPRALRITNSFREFTKNIRKSFRIKRGYKKAEGVEVRQRPDGGGTPRAECRALTYPNAREEAYATLLLPRSRFQERLSRTIPSHSTPKPSNDYLAPNPFDEDAANDDGVRTIRRRLKKRAPMPPKSVSSENVNNHMLDESSHHQSKWSLTSVETDTTDNYSACKSEDDVSAVLAEELVSFNKEMERLNDDTNNNVIIAPDVVVSCAIDENSSIPNDTNNYNMMDIETNKTEINRIENDRNENVNNLEKFIDGISQTTKHLNNIEKLDNINNETDNINSPIDGVHEEIVHQITENNNKYEIDTETNEINNPANSANTVNDNDNLIIDDVKNISEQNLLLSENRSSMKEAAQQKCEEPNEDTSGNDEELVVCNVMTNVQDPDGKLTCPLTYDNIPDIDDSDDQLLYNEKKSIYISSSGNELSFTETYTGRYSLYIDGSKDDITNNNNTISSNNAIMNSTHEDTLSVPPSKQRKHKLTKNSLLGTND